jgi:hypothetical protein
VAYYLISDEDILSLYGVVSVIPIPEESDLSFDEDIADAFDGLKDVLVGDDLAQAIISADKASKAYRELMIMIRKGGV